MNMKFKYLLPAAMLATAFSASAVPAYPGLLERTLEDGSTIMVRLNGDEYFNYLTDEQGFLMQNNGNHVSYQLKDGVRIMASDYLLEQMRAETEAQPYSQMLRAGEMKRMATLDANGQTNFCTLGDVHFLVLLVQYDDIKFHSPTIREDMVAMLNAEGYSENGCPGSVRDYYINSSHGKFRPTFDVSEVITLPKTSAYYTGGSKYENITEMVKTAVQLADDQVDFSKYCNMNANECDAVIIWYAGYGQADTANPDFIWPHQSTISYANVVLDGVKIGTYCCFNELNGGYHYREQDYAFGGLGTPIHEFGHVMGFPDLYDPNYVVKSTPGSWSVFDQGPYLGDGYCPPAFSAYERYLNRWIDFEDVVAGKHYDLQNLNDSNRAIRIPVINSNGDVYSREYFVLESRSKTGWDKYLPGNGMLIWHIDYDANTWKYNAVNSVESRKRCHIITADGSANYALGKHNAPTANAAWPYNIDYLTPDTDITLNTYYVFAKNDKGSSFITDMKYNQALRTSSFDYNIVTETPVDATILNEPVRGLTDRGEANNDLHFSWEPVEGATGYQLSVYRKSGTTTFYETGLQEKNVGNVTSYVLPSLNRNKHNLEYTAHVRVVKGIPSKEISNLVVFTPANLQTSGVEGIVADNTPVLGLKGAVQAPENAEIYNMQGLRCGREGLNPGIYVVRVGDFVTKVTVK